MNPPSILWLNGSLQAAHEARLSPLDHGLLVGDGVFETLVVRAGQPFAGAEHYERLARSCQATGLVCITEAVFYESIRAVTQANGLQDARVRITLTSGDGPLGSDRGAGQGTVLVVATPLKPWPPTENVYLAPWTRNTRSALAGVKSVSYGENVRALLYAKERGCGEALLANEQDQLCEGTGSNVFVVVQGQLKTPPLASGCLAGITRQLVLRACEKAGIVYQVVDMPSAVLEECEEAFLTSSTRDVHPIATLSGRTLQAPGPVTQRVQQAFAEMYG
ncbi:branched-chain amino acid aminotransferase [Prosthecobacter fusiformis]|uniref:branched-chain-amino-acid transaminase n=1 Tax=Prosthecobacter fusiformis TaxID=48464 RepID=A0A4R7RIZ3_9BACT|nr:aminotransferase class IV [Prosthecobacter fusiformis]TDU64031.1 branched-chain amino acid aminotransferase [Prosthecobacter fusiformis]